MGEIRLPGLFTGIDTGALVSQLMMLERRTLEVYQSRQEAWNDRKNALSSLKSMLDSLRIAAKALSDSKELRSYATASSNTDILTAEASYNAFEGNHTIVVNQLANAERWVHTVGKEYAESLVGAGTFIYSYNHQETVITTAAGTTLEDLVGLINNDANNPGVTANLLLYNGAYHLMLNGNGAGSDYEITVNDSNTEVWQAVSSFTVGGKNASPAHTILALDQFSGTLAGDESITITGQMHDGTAVSQTIAVNEHTTLNHVVEEINDAFAGTATATLVNGRIRLTDNASGVSQMELSLAYDSGSGTTTLDIPVIGQSTQGGTITASLADFTAADFTETQSARDSQIRVDGYPSGPDEWITRSSNTIDNVILGVTLHLHDAGTAQVNLTRDIQSVKEKLTSMVTAYNKAAAFIKEKTGYNEALKSAGLLMGDLVISNLASDLRLPFIRQTSGFTNDADSFLMPGHIGLSLDRDGMLSLDSGVFDEAIATDYMGVLSVIGADKTGSSDSNTIQYYGASSAYTSAGTYDVEVTVSGGLITAAGIRLAGESTYRDVTVNGNIITGNSTFDSNGNPVYPENGLQLSVDLSQDGTFAATVRVKQGFAGALEDALDRILKATTGVIPMDQQHIDDQIEQLQRRIEDEEARLERREAGLVARFTRLEKTLAILQNQMAALNLG